VTPDVVDTACAILIDAIAALGSADSPGPLDTQVHGNGHAPAAGL
jgi:hypothetical protein